MKKIDDFGDAVKQQYTATNLFVRLLSQAVLSSVSDLSSQSCILIKRPKGPACYISCSRTRAAQYAYKKNPYFWQLRHDSRLLGKIILRHNFWFTLKKLFKSGWCYICWGVFQTSGEHDITTLFLSHSLPLSKIPASVIALGRLQLIVQPHQTLFSEISQDHTVLHQLSTVCVFQLFFPLAWS